MRKSMYLMFMVLYNICMYGQEKKIILYFDFDVKTLSSSESEKVKQLISTDEILSVNGYADKTGNVTYNKYLSRKRVNHVISLVNDHIPNIIIPKKAFGETIEFGEDDENRRVEIIYKESIPIDLASAVAIQADTNTIKNKETPSAIAKIKDLKIGETIALKKLEFIPGRHVIQSYSKGELEKLLKTMEENPNLKIEIQGHICCDNSGKDGYDFDTHKYELSTMRAKEVYDYLLDGNIKKDRLTYKGYAMTMPLVKEIDDKTRQMNRRVEIKIIER